MHRGEIYLADLNPTIGSEINKKRLVLIISNDISNFHSDVVTVAPITSNISKIYPFEAFIQSNETSGLSLDSKAQAQQIRTISKVRIIKPQLGNISSNEMENIEMALRLHLCL